MRGKIFDENTTNIEVAVDSQTDWYPVNWEDFDIYGLIRPEADGILSRRFPSTVAKTVDDAVIALSTYGAGGRILFSTDSPFIALKAEYGFGEVAPVNNHCFTYGFDLYRTENGKNIYTGAFRPGRDFDYETLSAKVNTGNNGQVTDYTLNMPHFVAVKKLYLGIQKGSFLGRGKHYRNEKPVVFYGSSITQGSCASRPGNTYENLICQKYDLDYVNMGLAGRAKGEPSIAEYLSSLDMCMFVSDYDHNAPSAEHLEKTHYPLYEAVRRNHPDIPYVMISTAEFFANPVGNGARREVIIRSYEKAKATGDQNVYFIDGKTLFAGDFAESCTTDSIHPNDLGFYRMADVIGSTIAKILGIE